MLGSNIWRGIVGVDRHVVIEDVEVDEEVGEAVVHVRLHKGAPCPCGLRALGYDQGEGRCR